MPDGFPQSGDNYGPVTKKAERIIRKIAREALRQAIEDEQPKKAKKLLAILDGLDNDREVF